MSAETHVFQAEVSRLLEIVTHSLYSERDVFLRELISNASDACDRLRYEAQTTPGLLTTAPDFRIELVPDKARRTLTVRDNGIGMNRDELLNNLGTIARSGTGEFLKQLAANKDKNGSPSLIGQFGVGFYAAFMVADRVIVRTTKAGTSESWRWTSDGKGEFTLEACDAGEAPTHGTAITLELKEDASEFLEDDRLKDIVTRYSDHIAFPIIIPAADGLQKTLNTASALWLQAPKDITPEQYKEFYHHIGHAFDDPWLTLHWHAEGTLDYRALLFIPSLQSFDLADPERKHRVKLYARRVFITEAAKGLLPPYLRFVRGVVDSEDLPLNVSREMLQNNPILDKIKSGLTKRVLGDLAKEAKDESKAEAYATFWQHFGAVVKEGLYEDRDHQALLLKLCRFHTTRTMAEDGPMISLETYVSRMAEGQTEILTISGADRSALMRSPQLEGYKAKNLEVLLLTDPVDDFWPGVVEKYQEKTFRSVTKGDAKLTEETKKETPETLADLLKIMKETLAEAVTDVRESQRLTTSPVCLVAEDNGIDMNLAKLLRAHKQLPEKLPRVLEINPQHSLIQRLGVMAGNAESKAELTELCWLLLDQARILEGEPLPDPAAFATRLTAALGKGLAA